MDSTDFQELSATKFQFAFVTSVSAVADAARDGLTAANAKIAANIYLFAVF